MRKYSCVHQITFCIFAFGASCNVFPLALYNIEMWHYFMVISFTPCGDYGCYITVITITAITIWMLQLFFYQLSCCFPSRFLMLRFSIQIIFRDHFINHFISEFSIKIFNFSFKSRYLYYYRIFHFVLN